jgi:PTH2 family peptidyl-tRNA hydrolase
MACRSFSSCTNVRVSCFGGRRTTRDSYKNGTTIKSVRGQTDRLTKMNDGNPMGNGIMGSKRHIIYRAHIRRVCYLIMTFSTGFASQPPWLYFLAGALLPSLAMILMRRQTPTRSNDDDDEHDDETDDEDMDGVTSGGPSSKWGYKDAPYKMVLCVNQELQMGKGKIAAQCCHACLACYKRASKQCPAALRAWEVSGCAKIALKCPTQDELELIAARAESLDIPCYLVEDAGRTQIAAGSRTVLGLGPAPAHVFEGLTSHLKLM